jgi:hypothetical protein
MESLNRKREKLELEKADVQSWQYNIRCLVSEIDNNWDPLMETKKILFGYQPIAKLRHIRRMTIIKDIMKSKNVKILDEKADNPVFLVDDNFLVMTQSQGKNKGRSSIHFEINTDQLMFLLITFPNFYGYFEDYRTLIIWAYCMRNVELNRTKWRELIDLNMIKCSSDLHFAEEMFEWFSFYCEHSEQISSDQ